VFFAGKGILTIRSLAMEYFVTLMHQPFRNNGWRRKLPYDNKKNKGLKVPELKFEQRSYKM
jgi:hypothetical protein